MSDTIDLPVRRLATSIVRLTTARKQRETALAQLQEIEREILRAEGAVDALCPCVVTESRTLQQALDQDHAGLRTEVDRLIGGGT